jgi:hypothetical protein
VIQRASDGMYFRFSTGSGIQITKATSLSGPWTIQGYALPSGSSINLSGNTDLWVSERTSSFDLSSTIKFPIKTGPRCPLSRQHLLSLLRRVYIRQPELSHRSRHVFHNGSRIVDRSWCHWSRFFFFKSLQCNRSQSHQRLRNILSELRFILGRHISSTDDLHPDYDVWKLV